MCGIAGFYDNTTNKWDYNNLASMTRCLNHRGSDAEGFYFHEGIGLGHKRLSIIDLSKEANQPFYSSCKKYVIVFNGEIYNYKEIGKELNINLRTTSDTEVILEAYIKWGSNCLNKLNGMFAFAILNKDTKSLFIARDRIGIKPLFYFWDGHSFAFASELKSLVALVKNSISLKINYAAVNSYLHLGYIPQPQTIYRNTYKFPNGNYMHISGSDLKFSEFWNANLKISDETLSNETEAKEQLKNLVIDSVKRRMIADVPFGTFLSGGIDSSLVTAVAQSLSNKPINTFSIGFEYSKFDESKYAREVSKYLGTNHHEFTVTEKDALKLIPEIINIYDEPYADSSAVPTMLVSKMARKHVTMTLSGDGGDELFMGYGAYLWAKRLNNPTIKIFRYPIAFLLSNYNSRAKRAAKLFNFKQNSDIRSHIFSQEQYFFSQSEIKKIMNPEFHSSSRFDYERSNSSRILLPEEEQSFFDLNYYLKDDLLTKVDRASMQHSLETRVPLLDHNIVEFALNLSVDLKIKEETSKYLLKEVLYDYVPKNYFNRPKWGFSIPLTNWLKKDLKYLQDEFLNEKTVKEAGLINLTYVSELKRKYNKGKHDYLYNRLWNLIILHQFFSKTH